MRVGTNLLLQSQLVELPADLIQLQLRFTEKMLKATIADKAQAAAALSSGVDVHA
jgi:hypothetical protein